MGMRKLEELFDLPTSGQPAEETATVEQTQSAITDIDNTIDKIDAALPAVRNLDASDEEMDALATKATDTFDNLMDLGFNVDVHSQHQLGKHIDDKRLYGSSALHRELPRQVFQG